MKNIFLFLICCFISLSPFAQDKRERNILHAVKLNDHKVVLDDQGKIISWIEPQSSAYDIFLRQRWNFIMNGVPNYPGTSYPVYYFSCGYSNQNVDKPSGWMNDVGEKIPNWFESARLYYAYTGDVRPMEIVKGLIDYSLEHGISPADFAWPSFPYTTTNAGDKDFRGFTTRLVLHEIQVDHAADMGLTYYKVYQFTGDKKYLTAAMNVANVLAKNARTGTATHSVFPYRVVMSTGEVIAEYGANWMGAYSLFENLIEANLGDVPTYKSVLTKISHFLLEYPMETGYWTDGHTDTDINSHTYKSNMSASNARLYILDNPGFDPNWQKNIPKSIKWTETWFVDRCNANEPSVFWGANLVGEQDDFLPKMDYQTARYAAECARWYAVSKDEAYKEKAYRALNWVTYCNDSIGRAYESPVSVGVESWWSDCYGECPRMFYHVFAGIPEWAPSVENHILYSDGVLTNVHYSTKKVQYTAKDKVGTDYLRLAFKPDSILLDNREIPMRTEDGDEGYFLRQLENNDYALTIRRRKEGTLTIIGL